MANIRSKERIKKQKNISVIFILIFVGADTQIYIFVKKNIYEK